MAATADRQIVGKFNTWAGSRFASRRATLALTGRIVVANGRDWRAARNPGETNHVSASHSGCDIAGRGAAVRLPSRGGGVMTRGSLPVSAGPHQAAAARAPGLDPRRL